MKVLQVSPYVVEPPRTGGSHRTHGLVKEIPHIGGEVTRFCQGGSPDTYRALDFRQKVQVAENYVERRHLNPLHDLAMSPVLFGFPNVFAKYALDFADDGLDALLERSDIVLVREPWQLPVLLERSDVPVVYSSHNVEIDRFDQIQPPLYREVKEWVHELERIAVEESAATVCTSERDAEIYRERFDVDTPLFVLPNGTYAENLRERNPNSPLAKSLRQRYGIDHTTTVAIFVGSDYGPNVEAAKHVIQIAEEMEKTDPPVHFVIVGNVAHAIGVDRPNVTVTGFVEEFEGHFDIADLALNPMTTGGGTNIKLFDYFARGVPVVSTPFGVRGIDVEDGEEAFVRELNEFPITINELSADPRVCERVGARARELASEKYTWEAISKNLYEHLETLSS